MVSSYVLDIIHIVSLVRNSLLFKRVCRCNKKNHIVLPENAHVAQVAKTVLLSIYHTCLLVVVL